MSVFSKMAAPYKRSQYLNTANLNDSVVGGQSHPPRPL